MVVTKGAVASRAVTTALVGYGREVAISVSYFALKKSGVAIRQLWPLTCEDDPEPLG